MLIINSSSPQSSRPDNSNPPRDLVISVCPRNKNSRTVADYGSVFLTLTKILEREIMKLKEWTQTKMYLGLQKQTRIFANTERDRIFSKTKLENLKPQFREMLSSIKNHCERKGYMTEKQANAARVCWNVHNDKEANRRGVFSRSFRSMPRLVNEGIYWNNKLVSY